MLETLRIKNYALIDEIEIDFRPGFTVLTGETGAGKSIITGALNLALGARASSDSVREGARQAEVEAVFRPGAPSQRLQALLTEHGVELEDGELIVGRRVSVDGRSRAYVNGALAPASTLAALGEELVDMHGQHEHQSLLKPDRQLDLLDSYGGLWERRQTVTDLVRDLRRTRKALDDIEKDDREQARRVEFLRFEVNEIAEAGLESGEEERLKAWRHRMNHAEAIVAAANKAYALLYEDDGATTDTVGQAQRLLEDVAEADETCRAVSAQLAAVQTTIGEAAAGLRDLAGGVEFDAAELETVNARLALIGNLKRKYGDTIDAILGYQEEAAEEIAAYENRDERLAALREEAEALAHKAEAAAARLTKARKQAAKRLNGEITGHLRELGMEKAVFEVQFESASLGLAGADKADFALAANVGERLKPLRQVASGGEISRIMLAIKTVFAESDAIPTLIFDEIDAGVGGAVATKVAAKLAALAQTHQTICITHIAQIAAAATGHYHVAKASRKGRTLTRVARVEDEARAEEVARLLDGSLSELSLKHARALLEAS